MIVFTILLLAVLSHFGVDGREGREGGYLPCDNARDGVMDETFSLVDETLPSSTKLRTSSTRRYAHLSGEKKCREEHNPGFKRMGSIGHVTKSTCPGYLILNYDPYRIPETVVEVRCACRRCLEMTSGNECMEVKYMRQVLVKMVRKAKKVKKATQCVKAFEAFTVGCTCGQSRNVTAISDPLRPLDN